MQALRRPSSPSKRRRSQKQDRTVPCAARGTQAVMRQRVTRGERSRWPEWLRCGGSGKGCPCRPDRALPREIFTPFGYTASSHLRKRLFLQAGVNGIVQVIKSERDIHQQA